MPGQIDCTKHGRQQFALACIHVANAIDSDEQVGFYWGDNTDMGRPDAWCGACEKKRLANNGAWSDELFKQGDFKFLCVRCWDEAKDVLGATGGPTRTGHPR